MVCPWWLCYSFDNPLRRFIHDPERLLAPYVKPGMTVVDVGCGMGYFTIPLARIAGPGGKVIAVDLQQRMLDALVRRAEKAAVADRIDPHRCQKESLGVEGRPISPSPSGWPTRCRTNPVSSARSLPS
jgi:SAM-dependent methyltransferase